MGHVFTKTTLQDTGLLCFNEMVMPSCCALAGSHACDPLNQRTPCMEVRKAAGKQVQTDPRAKKHRKSKATAPPLHPNTHTRTLTSALRHHPPNRSGSRVGRKRGGKEAVAGILAFNLADSQLLLFLLGRVCLPGGHQGQETAVPPAPFFLPSTHLQSREAAAAPQLVPVSRSQKGSWGLFGNWYTCSSNGFAKLKFEVPSFCSGSQTPFCFKSSTFSPKRPSTMFLGSRNHTVIFKATLPAKCRCCPGP